jgi:betaine-aldehyde dehydrogenase
MEDRPLQLLQHQPAAEAVRRWLATKDKKMTSGQLNARHWIGGEWVDSKDRLDSINPATGEAIGAYANGGEAEATKAIAIAKQAFLDTEWHENRRLRAKAINEMADRFEARMPDLVEILALENGKIVDEARFEVAMAAPSGSTQRWR